MAKIGVFDSGIGGKSIANAIQHARPDFEVLYVNDSKNAPYGQKSQDELLELVRPFIDEFIAKQCSAIVIACNTVTTTIIAELRATTNIPIIGIEPMVKPAAVLSKSKTIAICATPTTLASNRYKELKTTYAKDITVLEPDCSTWAQMIESNQVNVQLIENQIRAVCSKGADVIVLGCTHYHWIEKEIQQTAKEYNAVVLQPEQAIVSRLNQVLEQLA